MRLIYFYFKHLFRFFLFSFIICCSLPSFSQSHVYAQLQGTPVNTTGWNLAGAATVGNITGSGNSEVILCPAQLNVSGAIFFNQPINLSNCKKWTAEFDFRIFDGTAADGIAFCFLDVPPSGFVTGGGLGIPSTANGLKVCFDQYPNCSPAATPKIEIRWGPGYNECGTQPTADNTNGTMNFIRSNTYNHAKIAYDNGNISVYANNTLYLTGFQQFNFTGYLGFTASTGGSTDNHSIKNVIIYTDMPPSEAGSDQIFCPGQQVPVQVGTTPNPAYLYNWSSSPDLSSITIANPIATVTNNTTNNDIVHKYFVHTAFSNAPSCASIDSVIITVKGNPTIAATSANVCAGDNYTLPSGIQVNTSGIYKDTLHYTTGCDSLIRIVTVDVKPPVIVNSGSDYICSGHSYTLPWGTVVNSAGIYRDTIKSTIGCDSIVWRFELVEQTVIFNKTTAIICGGQTYNLPWGVVVNASGIYNDTIRYVFGCDSLIKEVDLTVQQVTRNSIQRSICAGQFYTLPSGVVVNTDGIYVDTLRSTLAGCDSIITTLTLDTNLKPVITVGKSNDINCSLGIAKLKATGGNIYLWSPANTLDNPGIATPIAKPAVTTVYSVKVISADGCAAEDSIEVRVVADPSGNKFDLPNAFTPNNDGLNDCFGPYSWGNVTDLNFSIYNRWGSLLFHSKNPSECWDGNYKGILQAPGVYVYQINAITICGIIHRKGTITLAR